MSRRWVLLPTLAMLLAIPPVPAAQIDLGEPVVMLAAAVAETQSGFVGSTATITITSASNGTGHVFLDTFPLTEVDMQGSARLASRVAAQLSGAPLHEHDFFFVVRSSSEQIGGPSAGAAMTVGAIAALNRWDARDDVLVTGTINPDATVGPVGGIAEKAAAAAQAGVSRFLYPAGQEVVPHSDGRLVNMTPYCADELHIECVPVRDVLEAVALMTDHAFERPPVDGNVTGEEFLARLGPLSDDLVSDAQRIFDEAAAVHAAAPEGALKTALAERLANARALLDRARNETANETYYTAASTSFQSSIEARYVREASEYLAATDRALAIASTVAEARGIVQQVGLDVGAKPVEDTNSFEAVGAAQVRLLEAERRLADAETLSQQPRSPQDLLDALYQASYAAERAETAAWWLDLADAFPSGQPVETAALEEIARDTLTTSREEVAYVDAVFRSSGASGALVRSRELLDEADEAMTRGMYAGAMLDGLEASVRASVLLEVAGYGGSVPPGKFTVASEEAARAIQGARQRGVESILGQSAYEFGLSLKDDPTSLQDDEDRLTFLGMARVTANLAGLPGLFGQARGLDSRFQENPSAFRVAAGYVAAAFAVGIALGVGAGLTAMMPKPPEPSGSVGTAVESAEVAWSVPAMVTSATSAPAEEERKDGPAP